MAAPKPQTATSSSPKSNVLRFDKLCSSVDSTFWKEFGRRKIDKFQLSEEAVDIFGLITGGIAHRNVSLPAKVFLNESCFDLDTSAIPKFHFKVPGQLLNVNKMESFAALDKRQLLRTYALQIVEQMKSGSFIKNPAVLYQFFAISFADLKKHRYFYWLCFPAVVPKHFEITSHSVSKLTDHPDHEKLSSNFYRFCGDHPLAQSLLFVVTQNLSIQTLSSLKDTTDILMFGMIDNGSLPQNPSWFLRNILLALSVHFKLFDTKLQLLCVRNLPHFLSDSLILSVSCSVTDTENDTFSMESLLNEDNIRCVGWERDVENKLKPKQIDLAQHLDPVLLSAESVDLNLRLMRWRRLPKIDLKAIGGLKCLLCGAGTLGTYVSRCLLAWGCSNITFVDNGRVSFSNPVRQCLFRHKDAVDSGSGGALKAEAAANAVLEIVPNAKTSGHRLTIPMPGHFVSAQSEPAVKADFDRFSELVASHDVIFLLTDSRESRWLPTVLATVHSKRAINVALGFDSFVAIRHGAGDPIGCYFCNDVVAPMDSLKDRSLDQQCTVTRPGLAPIAAGVAVELMVAAMQKENIMSADPVPHQIRGSLFSFQNICIPPTPAYPQCSACSDRIVGEYKEKGWEFVKRALNDPKYLETVCGLDKLKDIDLDEVDIDWDDDDEEELEEEQKEDGTKGGL